MGLQNDGYYEKSSATKSGGLNASSREGLYLATVLETKDAARLGRIVVRIDAFGSTNDSGKVNVSLLTPFGGLTNHKDAIDDIKAFGDSIEETTGGTTKAYGMWPQPPAVGTVIVVAYVAGSAQPYYLGSSIATPQNHMLGGNGSSYHYDSDQSIPFKPTGEKNPNDTTAQIHQRPVDTEAFNVLKTQGLEKDWARGHSSSSARREDSSRVFGITTRGGHVLSMDDGDLNGNNKNIRFRTRGGAQILIDDTNDFIFIINHAGTAWVEIDKDGKMDYYAKDDISFHTEADFNIHCKGNFNLQADAGIQQKAMGAGGIKHEAATGSIDHYAAKDMRHEAGANGHMKCGGRYYETASRIDMNGPAAASAQKTAVTQHSNNKNVTQSVSGRVPEHHPWKGVTSQTDSFTGSLGKPL